MVLMVLASISMIILVLIQRGDSNNNINAITGGQETFFGKHKSRSYDGKLKLATVIVGCCLVLFSILYFVFQVLTSQLG
ncbi:MAG: preprotein translocase subunit SecG [Clostridia bacterium]|nr:preprotein translocase subunit SecG [Clostridia bacterium]